MSRYIDRDFLERRIHETMDMQDLYLPINFIQLMNEQDAADAVEVKHGHWIPGNTPDAFCACSRCGFPLEAHGAFKLYKYCTQCGAKMDEVKE